MKITRRTEQEINISELKAAIKEGRGLEVIRRTTKSRLRLTRAKRLRRFAATSASIAPDLFSKTASAKCGR